MQAEKRKDVVRRRILLLKPSRADDPAFVGKVALAPCALLCQCYKCRHARHTRKGKR
jgi:hypothetical protein